MDLSLLPDIFGLAIFLAGIRPLLRRTGKQADLWFVGGAAFLLHDLFLLVLPLATGSRYVVVHLLALWALDACGLTFLIAAAKRPYRQLPLSFRATLALPVLTASAFTVVWGNGMLPWVPLSLLSLLPAIYLAALKWRSIRSPKMRGPVSIALAFAVAALGLVPLRNTAMLADTTLAICLLCAAWLYARTATRTSGGGVAAVVGLAWWGISLPLVGVVAHMQVPPMLVHVFTTVPAYLAIAGLLLTQLEDHVLLTEQLANHDPLTNLPNRRFFETRLTETMYEAQLQRRTLACLVIDVDNFKLINDSLGHTAGDALLRALAVRLSWHISPRDLLARTGGDEFTALLAGVSDQSHLRFIAGCMMSASSMPIEIDGLPVDVRISIGIALSPDDATDTEGLRRAADEAMYAAKSRGGSLLAYAGELSVRGMPEIAAPSSRGKSLTR